MRATGHGERPPARLVHRRARRPREGDPGGGEVPQDAAPPLRRRLAPGAGVVQRRPRARAARRQAIGHRRLLAAQRVEAAAAAARDARVRADDPGGDDHRPQPRAVPASRSRPPSRSPTELVTLNGPVDLRRIAEWAGVPADDDPRAQPGAAALDDAGARQRLRGEGAGRHGRGGRARRIAATAPEEAASLQWLRGASKGESLATIARKLRVSRTDLAEANYLRTTATRPAGPEAGRPPRAVAGHAGPPRRHHSPRPPPIGPRSPRRAADGGADHGRSTASAAATRSTASPASTA